MTKNKAIKHAKVLAKKSGIAHLVYFEPDYSRYQVMSEQFFYCGTISESEVVAQVEENGEVCLF